MHLTTANLRESTPLGRWLALRGGALVLTVLIVSALAGWTRRVRAADEVLPPRLDQVASEIRSLTKRLQESEGQLAIARIQIERADAIMRYSTAFRIPADLTAAIYDIALSEGIDPAIAFRLVQVESGFEPRATSSAGAVGFTQIRLATARYYEPGLELEQLYHRDVNLRLGFRFLKDLMDRYDQDVALALVAYNRGPSRVQAILDQGGNPSNGYAESVMKGTGQGKPTPR